MPVDAFADLLDGARARGALFNQTVLEPPWSLRIADGAPLALATMLRGHAWIVPDAGPPVMMRTGDIAIMRGPAPYTIADDPATPPQLVIHSGSRYTTPEDVEIGAELSLGLRTCGETLAGSALVVSGTYQVAGDISGRLLTALPQVLVVPEENARGPLMDLVVAEINKEAQGQQVVLDRLLDLALIATLRAWFARPEAEAPAWYGAQGDAIVGPALRALHDDPAQPWTVATLAARSGVSRATFARRFTALLGEPPMSYLTEWRIALAADLIRETDTTVESIARRVGYSNAFTLSVAFKRVRGVSPTRHRMMVG